jgi:hypothetical protein
LCLCRCRRYRCRRDEGRGKFEAYGAENLEELGEKSQMTVEKIRQKVDELNQRLRERPEDRFLKKAVKTLEEKRLPRLEKYEEQERLVIRPVSFPTCSSRAFLRAESSRMVRGMLAMGVKKPMSFWRKKA